MTTLKPALGQPLPRLARAHPAAFVRAVFTRVPCWKCQVKRTCTPSIATPY